jgi:Family of unknown function (DUF6166)
MILVNFGLKQPAGTVYRGRPAAGGHYKNGKLKRPIVTVNGERLDPRLDLWEMSPTGFNWGYGGAGPSQLALAVLAHAAGDQVAMEEWYRFRQEVIKQLDMHRPFAFSAKDVEAFLGGQRIDAARFIRPVRQKATPGFWKRLLDKSA